MAPYNWKDENKPEGWEAVARGFDDAIDDGIYRAYNPGLPLRQVSMAPEEKIHYEYEPTKWRYMETRRRRPDEGYVYGSIRNDFHDEFEYTARCMTALILTVKGEVRYKASNGVYIVSIRTGTQWIDTERRLHICRLEPGIMPGGNTGIVVNESSFQLIMEAVEEYNRPQETPLRVPWPDFITRYEYDAMTPGQKEIVKRLYHGDECSLRWIRNDYTVPVTKKKVIVDDKILSDDMFKVE